MKSVGLASRKVSGTFVSMILICFSIAPVVGAGTLHAAPGFSNSVGTEACTTKELETQILATGRPVSIRDSIDFAQASQQYQSDTAGFSISFQGANDGWLYNSICQVSWTSIAVNFLMVSANGSKYNLAISENPKIGVIYTAAVSLAVYSAISPTCNFSACQWSGYGISGNSQNNAQIYEANAYWYQTTVSAPPVSQASCTDLSTVCNLDTWIGLTDSTAPGSGTIVQTGVYATYIGIRSPPDTYTPWTEIYPAQSMLQCPSGDVVSHGDEMYADVENQYAYNLTTGNNYYMLLRDLTANWICQPATNPQSVSFTPHYAAFIAERVNPGTYHLAQFTQFSFLNCGIFISSLDGVWPEYNLGYGYGVYMLNNFYQETSTSAMTQNPGSNYAGFSITWLSSSGS